MKGGSYREGTGVAGRCFEEKGLADFEAFLGERQATFDRFLQTCEF